MVHKLIQESGDQVLLMVPHIGSRFLRGQSQSHLRRGQSGQAQTEEKEGSEASCICFSSLTQELGDVLLTRTHTKGGEPGGRDVPSEGLRQQARQGRWQGRSHVRLGYCRSVLGSCERQVRREGSLRQGTQRGAEVVSRVGGDDQNLQKAWRNSLHGGLIPTHTS